MRVCLTSNKELVIVYFRLYGLTYDVSSNFFRFGFDEYLKLIATKFFKKKYVS